MVLNIVQDRGYCILKKNIFFFHSLERCTILCLAETGDNLNKIKPQLLSRDRVWPKFFSELRLGYNRDPKFIVNRLPIRLFTTFEKIIGEWMCRISKFLCFNQEKCSWHEMLRIKDVTNHQGIWFSDEFPWQFLAFSNSINQDI